MRMWIWEGDGRTLLAGMSEIQRTKEDSKEKCRNGQDEAEVPIGKYKGIKTHGGIHRHDQKTRIVQEEPLW